MLKLMIRTVDPTTAAAALLMLAAAIIGARLVYFPVASDVRGAVTPIEQIGSTLLVKTIASASAHTAISARPPLPAFSGARFRFGFLEFEDDPDAPAE